MRRHIECILLAMRTRLLSAIVLSAPLSAMAVACGSSAVDEGVVTPDPPPASEGGRDVAAEERDSAEPVDAADAARIDAASDAGVDPCTSPDLVGCFTFEGPTLEDRSPTKLAPVVVQELVFGVGRSGQGLEVKPTTNIRFAPSAAFNLSTVTVEAFVKVAALPGGDQIIFDADQRYSMFLQPSGGIRCNGSGDEVAGGTVAAGKWVHVACVWGGGMVRVYIDGVLAVMSGGGTANGGGQEAIGGDAPSGNNRFAGSIDTMRIFKVVRTPAEMAEAAR